MLVIGVFPIPERRQMFEEAFARQLRKYIDRPSPSYKFLPAIAGVDRAQIETLVRDQQMDAVVITRLIKAETIQTDVPGHPTEIPSGPLDGAASYFDMAKQDAYTPGYQAEQTVAILETKIFDARTGVCVWTCRSDTLVNGYLDDLIADFVGVMIQALSG